MPSSPGSSVASGGGETRGGVVVEALPTKNIVVSKTGVDSSDRAVHKIRLEALSHNYTEVEAAANRQRCSVFVVVKADGYGHGAIATAVYLADSMGADAFAVATLEEGIALRRAFQQTLPGKLFVPPSTTTKVPQSVGGTQTPVSSLFHAPTDDMSTGFANNHHGGGGPSVAQQQHTVMPKRRSRRPTQIRIMVLGPPVGFPRCFDDYYHHNIEAMISGPESAKSLLEWVINTDERKRTQVERQANELKELVLNEDRPRPGRVAPVEHRDSNMSNKSSAENSIGSDSNNPTLDDGNNPRCHPQSATLGNVTGSDLAKEVREILRNQKLAAQQQPPLAAAPSKPAPSGTATPQTEASSSAGTSSNADSSTTQTPAAPAPAPKLFGGIEEAAKMSRTRQKVIKAEVFVERGDDDEDMMDDARASPTTTDNNKHRNLTTPRKRLRWHALVDSGMGRLGFRTDPVPMEEQGKRADAVDILKELVDLENSMDCPVEFFGMVTHMADANENSDYTNSQIAKFKSLLKRVRAAGISVPTISTDNSAALLTTTLKHFDPNELLTADTRGFVRTGGAIYGQRPSFPQLRAVSTLMASVRHVANLKQGESVGYDRAYIAPTNVRIATLTIGFADGYPRELGNGIGKVCIRGHLFPVAGNVCMDMLMVELGRTGESDEVGANVVVGDSAILWGPGDDDDEGEGPVRLQDIAAILKTTQSALTCGLDKERVRREYG